MIYLKLLLQEVAEDVRKTIKRTVCTDLGNKTIQIIFQ